MTKSCGNTEKYLLKNTTVMKLLKHYFFIKVLVTKEKKRNKQCEFDFNPTESLSTNVQICHPYNLKVTHTCHVNSICQKFIKV